MSVVDKIRLRSTSAKDSNNVVISEDGLLVIFLSKCAHIYYPIYSDGSFYMTKTIEYDWSLSDSIIDDRVTTIYKSGVKRTMQDLLVNSNISYDMNSIIRSCTWTLSSLYNGSLSLLTILTRNGCCLMIDSNSNSNCTNEYKTMDLIIKPHDVSIVYDFSKAFNDNKSNKATSTATTTKDSDIITCIKFFPFFEKSLTFSHSKQLLAVVGSNGKISLWKLSKNDDFPQLNGDILTCYEFAIPDVNDNVTSIVVIEQTQLIPNVYALILCGTSKGQLLMLHVFKDVSNEYQLHVVWKHDLHSSIFDITVGNDDEIFVAGDAGKVFVCNISNSMILCVDDMHSNIITGLKTIGCYRGQVNNRNKLLSSIISCSFDGMIKCWDYSNTLPYTRNMLASNNNLNEDMNIVSKRTEIKVSNLVQGVSCDPWGIIVAYSEVEPATHITSRKQHLAKQKHGGTAVTMITNPILASDWCINIEEWIKVFHSMLSNSNANRLGLIPLSIAISKNLQIYYQGYHINLNNKGGSTYKEELIDNESSDSDDSDDDNAGKQHSNPSSNDPLIQKQHKIDTMKLLVENVVTNKLGKLTFIVKIIIEAIIKVGVDHHLNNTNIIGNIDDEEICHAQLLGLPSDATTEIIDKKLLLWKTLNHVVQGIYYHHYYYYCSTNIIFNI